MGLYDRTEWTYRRPADAEADRTPWLEAVRKLNRSVRDRPTDHRPRAVTTPMEHPSRHYPHSPGHANVRWQHRTAYLRNKESGSLGRDRSRERPRRSGIGGRSVAYLAGIGERDITRLGAQCRFRERVTRQLDRLSDRISAEDRKRVERYYKKECHVRRACNSINGIARARAYSDQIGDTPVENWPR